MTVTLFYSPGACSLAPHIALEETGAEFQTTRVTLREGAHRRPEYLAINPKGRVPALAVDRGVLTENPVILGYIAQTWPDAKLAPNDDSFAFGRMQAFNMYLATSVHVAFAHAFRPERYAEGEAAAAAMRARTPIAVAEYFSAIEADLADGAWVHGDYTVSDPYLFVFTGWAPRIDVDMAPFPKLRAHRERMLQRPAVQRALAREESPTG